MLKPDQYFKDYLQFEIEKEYRRKAQVSFRRAIREFYVMQSRYVIEPVKGRRVQRIEYGRTSLRQKNNAVVWMCISMAKKWGSGRN